MSDNVGERPRPIHTDTWKAATWAVPFTVQLVVAAAIGVSWLQWRAGAGIENLVSFLASVAVTALVAAVTGVALLRARESRTRGIGLSLVGCSAIVLLAGLVVGWVLYTG
ncbi:hypothetical protein [Mycobacterium sp. URHB0044]|uniref:hypothetical protein n=1 Tax=Mycobacterium sp. URHB0044 TaxID=1380386 RepID=UPI00055A725B|nr:hypothetical protein [Mycobacterium sp. URHB0044]